VCARRARKGSELAAESRVPVTTPRPRIAEAATPIVSRPGGNRFDNGPAASRQGSRRASQQPRHERCPASRTTTQPPSPVHRAVRDERPRHAKPALARRPAHAASSDEGNAEHRAIDRAQRGLSRYARGERRRVRVTASSRPTASRAVAEQVRASSSRSLRGRRRAPERASAHRYTDCLCKRSQPPRAHPAHDSHAPAIGALLGRLQCAARRRALPPPPGPARGVADAPS
jgi:hypothetical protein